jgi:hypothetical protein
MNETLQVLRALNAAADRITEDEEDGYGVCRYCGAESYGVTEDGARAGETDEVVEYHIDHEAWCPSYILDHAYAGLDQPIVDRVLAQLTDAAAARD